LKFVARMTTASQVVRWRAGSAFPVSLPSVHR
jgi:hypothetical protein